LTRCPGGGRVVNVSSSSPPSSTKKSARDRGSTSSRPRTAAGRHLRSLVARGLDGVELVVSDAHAASSGHLQRVRRGSWQRCRTHSWRICPQGLKDRWPMVATSSARSSSSQTGTRPGPKLADVVDKLSRPVSAAWPSTSSMPRRHLVLHCLSHGTLAEARSNNPQERLNKEIRRRTDVVGIFPNRQAVIRLVGAILAEQSDEWPSPPATAASSRSGPAASSRCRNTDGTDAEIAAG